MLLMMAKIKMMTMIHSVITLTMLAKTVQIIMATCY